MVAEGSLAAQPDNRGHDSSFGHVKRSMQFSRATRSYLLESCCAGHGQSFHGGAAGLDDVFGLLAGAARSDCNCVVSHVALGRDGASPHWTK